MVASKANLARWAYTSIFYRQGNRILFRCGICAFHGKQRSLPKPRPLPNTPAAPLAGKERCESMSKRQGCFSISKKNCFRIAETITFVTYQPCGVLFLLWNRNCYSAVDSILRFLQRIGGKFRCNERSYSLRRIVDSYTHRLRTGKER